MKNKKKALGQYYTKEKTWLLPHIIAFINETKCSTVFDPFAGEGDLISAVIENCSSITKEMGYDIDASLKWTINDSLISIPSVDNAIIVTNPPYISNYSAARKHIIDDLRIYFNSTEYDDVYLLALDNCLKAQDYVVAIIPETFINSSYKQKNRLHSITVLENNPFEDTDCPVIIACFDGIYKDYSQISIYKNTTYIGNLEALESLRLNPNYSVEIDFNNPAGWLGVRCIDGVYPYDKIHFDYPEKIDYDWVNGIKNSSRLFTLIDIKVEKRKRKALIETCNAILDDLRVSTSDIILSPFKGNNKDGIRRRRLDFLTCRAIIEKAYWLDKGGENEQ